MYGGYCFFNNAAIAAEAIVRATGERVAILDVDYHHGNGSQQIFWRRGDVRTSRSTPIRTAYPYFLGRADETGEGDGAGENLNIPLRPGTTNAEYLVALDRALEAIAAVPGSVVVVSLGFDTYGLDPIGTFALTTDAYHEMGRRTAALGRRLVILQEGGYHRPHSGGTPGPGCVARRAGRSTRSRSTGSASLARWPARRSVGRVAGYAPLTAARLAEVVAELSARDADLGGIVERHGNPPLWDREPGFPTLLHIILEQQVSLASARRHSTGCGPRPLTPRRFLELSDGELLAIGFSRQKARYGRALATSVASGQLDLDGLVDVDDAIVHERLQAIPGIGPWTSTIYLLMVLGRPDVWPVGDIALAESVGAVKGLGHRPDAAEMLELGDAWRPWRSVAARLFWHDYLARRGRSG